MADKLADTCTKTLYNWPHVLELEYGTCCIAWFYELDEYFEQIGIKKRYISWKFMVPDMRAGKLSANGVEIRRRGSMRFVRTAYQNIVDEVWGKCVVDGKMADVDKKARQERALGVLRTQLLKLEKHEIGVDEFVYTQGLTSAPAEYKNQAKPHVQAAIQEIQAYERGELDWAPQPGNRVAFVPIFKGVQKRNKAERVVSRRLYDPTKHVLDRGQAAEDVINPLNQVLQPLQLCADAMATTTQKWCRGRDAKNQATHAGGGVQTVTFDKCLLKEPPPAKATQPTINKQGAIRMKARMHKPPPGPRKRKLSKDAKAQMGKWMRRFCTQAGQAGPKRVKQT